MAIVACMAISHLLNAQPPPPPPPVEHGSANNQSEGAPVGDGIGFLLALSAFYGSARFYRMKTFMKKNLQGQSD